MIRLNKYTLFTFLLKKFSYRAFLGQLLTNGGNTLYRTLTILYMLMCTWVISLSLVFYFFAMVKKIEIMREYTLLL